MSELKKKILAKIARPALSALATITEDGKPWVRYCTPFADENLTIWLGTFINSRKVDQIRRNSEVHVTVGVTDPEKAESYIQVQGRAEILTDPEAKKAAWGDHLRVVFSGPDDPNLAACKITPYRIEYQTLDPPGSPPEVWEA
jgi:general stress protein 26